MMELRMEMLKELQKNGSFAAGRNASEAIADYEQTVEHFAAEQKQKKESGLLSRLDERRGHAVVGRMEQDLSVLRGETFADAAGVWERQRELFAADSDAYEEEIAQAGQCLEYAFNFMEGAFADGQEMVLFVTELNTGFYSVRFLQEYECERYYEYNRNLLFSTEEDALREAIAANQQ
jgi:hypothetical protein